MKLATFKSQGKLLISGEYVILDGALSLAVPTRFGQTLDVEAIEMSKIIWKSFNEQDKVWFQNEFKLNAINNQKQYWSTSNEEKQNTRRNIPS